MTIKIDGSTSYNCPLIAPVSELAVQLLNVEGKSDRSLGHFITAELLGSKEQEVATHVLKVDKRHFNGYGSALIHVKTVSDADSTLLIETSLSRYVSVCLRYNHLLRFKSKLSMSSTVKNFSVARIDEQLNNLSSSIKELAKQSALMADVITKVVHIKKGEITFCSTDLSSAFLTALLIRNGHGSAVVDTPAFAPVRFTKIQNSSPDIESKFEQTIEQNFRLVARECAIRIDTQHTYDISVNRELLTRLFEVSRLFSSCSDVIFNLVLFKDEFSTSESFMRGLTFYKNLQMLDNNIGETSILRYEFITNFDDLYQALFGKRLSHSVTIDDVKQFLFKRVDSDSQTFLTSMQFVSVLSHPSCKVQNYSSFSFAGYSYLIPEDCKDFTKLTKTEIANICDLIWVVTALSHGLVTTVDLDRSQIKVSLAKFLSVIDRNFYANI